LLRSGHSGDRIYISCQYSLLVSEEAKVTHALHNSFFPLGPVLHSGACLTPHAEHSVTPASRGAVSGLLLEFSMKPNQYAQRDSDTKFGAYVEHLVHRPVLVRRSHPKRVQETHYPEPAISRSHSTPSSHLAIVSACAVATVGHCFPVCVAHAEEATGVENARVRVRSE
jgi:hypothetical protein